MISTQVFAGLTLFLVVAARMRADYLGVLVVLATMAPGAILSVERRAARAKRSARCRRAAKKCNDAEASLKREAEACEDADRAALLARAAVSLNCAARAVAVADAHADATNGAAARREATRPDPLIDPEEVTIWTRLPESRPPTFYPRTPPPPRRSRRPRARPSPTLQSASTRRMSVSTQAPAGVTRSHTGRARARAGLRRAAPRAGVAAGAAGVPGAARRDVGGAPLAAVDGVAAALCVRPARRIAVLVLGLARAGRRVAGPRRVFGQRARRRRAGGRRPARVDLARAPQERAGGAPRVAPRGGALQGRGRAAALRLPRGLLRRRL